VLVVGCLGLVYIGTSTALIAYNKYLINADRFPFSVTLVLIHAVFSSCLSAVVFLLKPSLFPSLTDPERKVDVDRGLILKGALPIAFFFAGQLVLSNTAYLHSSVAFLQMMKESNLVLVYIFSLAAALERFNWRNAWLLMAVLAATTMTIHGELHFSFTGFMFQGTSQLFESIKIVLQAMLLSSHGRKLDALTYVLLVMPLCAMILGAGLLVLIYVWPSMHLMTPTMADLFIWWPHLLANGFVAFALNVVVALFVKHSSAVSFILAGITKDAMIVLSGVAFLSEVISIMQGVGFALQLAFILVYTLMKTFPAKFEHGIPQGIVAVLLGDALAPKKLPTLAAPTLGKDYGALEEATSTVKDHEKGQSSKAVY